MSQETKDQLAVLAKNVFDSQTITLEGLTQVFEDIYELGIKEGNDKETEVGR